jgi:hypothetical protein
VWLRLNIGPIRRFERQKDYVVSYVTLAGGSWSTQAVSCVRV